MDKLFRQLADVITQNEKEYYFFHQNRYQKLVSLIKNRIEKNKKIIDIGCGFGHILYILKLLGFDSLTGLDGNLNFSGLKERFNERRIEFIKHELSMPSMPIGDNKFDAALFTEVLEHFNFYPQKFFCEINRILKPSGLLIITTPNLTRLNNRIKLLVGKSINYNIEHNFDKGAHFREYTVKEMRYLLNQAGFRDIEFKFINFKYPDQNFFVYLLNLFFGFIYPGLRSNILVIARK